MKRILIFLIIVLVALTACEQSLLGTINDEDKTSIAELEELEGNLDDLLAENETNSSIETEPVEDIPSRFAITKTEGDLVILAPEAIDPDGDMVSYQYAAPFDAQGKWQTSYGDAGEYTVAVTATDTKGASTTESIAITIVKANRKPYLNCPARVTAKEGDVVNLGCEANDEEGSVMLTYFGWMLTDTYQTTFEDAGTHEVRVVGTDTAGLTDEATIEVVILNVNRPPVFPIDFPQRLVGEETDVFAFDTSEVYDPDGDAVEITFSDPFNDAGIWKSELGDGGNYPVDVVASDGSSSTKKQVEVQVTMINTAPVLKRIPDVTVYEGEVVRLQVDASDREGDELVYTYSGWMTSSTYQTGYDDAGTYTVKVTASDGQHSDSQVVHITVIDRNRPPQFIVPA